jgi:hypothetical protein
MWSAYAYKNLNIVIIIHHYTTYYIYYTKKNTHAFSDTNFRFFLLLRTSKLLFSIKFENSIYTAEYYFKCGKDFVYFVE